MGWVSWGAGNDIKAAAVERTALHRGWGGASGIVGSPTACFDGVHASDARLYHDAHGVAVALLPL